MQGFNFISWNGRNQFGRELANGIYIYKIIATDNNNKNNTVSYIGRCAIFK